MNVIATTARSGVGLMSLGLFSSATQNIGNRLSLCYYEQGLSVGRPHNICLAEVRIPRWRIVADSELVLKMAYRL